MTDFEKRFAQAARSLAAHLIRYARERRDEEKKAIASSHIELARLYREEQAASKEAAK